MTNDEKINIILESIKNHGTIPLYDWIARELNEHDRESENNHRIIINKMVDSGLIKRATDGSERYGVTTKGIEITETGGWIKYLSDKKIKEELKNKQPIINITTGDIGQIQKNYGTIGGNMSYSSDSSQNNSIIPGTTNKKNILKTISIVIGVIVGLVTIIYYVFEILKKP